MIKCPECSAIHPDAVTVCFCGKSLKNQMFSSNTSFEYSNNQSVRSAVHPQLPTRKLSFYAKGGELFGIFIINVLLTLITLGIYYFWGKVRVRKYIYNKTEFEGERFAYHGTGKELFIGWSIAAVFLGIIFALGIAAELIWKGILTEILSTLFISLGILILIPPAVVLSQKYRLSRTSWRGIRFSFRGTIGSFMRLYIPGLILVFLTLGIYSPYFETNLRRYLVTNSYFGNSGFEFDGRGNDLLGEFIVAIILSIFTLGIYWFWFLAYKHNYFWSHSYFKEAKFRSEITGGSLLLLKFTNLLLLVFTLGLAWPWVTIRSHKYLFDRLFLDGDLNLSQIEQDAKEVSATGEGFSDILDIDVFGMSIGI